MPVLRIIQPGFPEIEAEFRKGTVLADILRDAGVSLYMPCGGHGTCGKCRVFTSRGGEPEHSCLACETYLSEDAAVRIPSVEQNVVSIETGTDPYMPLTAPMGKRYGIALDIGTTTLAMALLSLETGKILATVSCLNPQRQISADVIGRIGAAISGQGDELQQMVRSAAELLLLEACRIAGIRPEEVDARVVTGNTTMLYLFTGRNPYTLSRAPFLADCLFGFSEQGIYYPSCFSAFVGADITCSVLASGMLRTQGTSMMIDLGTNGEIVLLHDGVLYGTSTAAGPAFEGGEISCGSMNVRGAIDRVRVREGSYEVHVLGDTEASSICGSGIIDAVAAFLELGRIDASGAIREEMIPVAGSVQLTKKDIRQIQMAKAAVSAGMEALCSHAGIGWNQVGQLYIAGGFGNHLNLASAASIGLIPGELLDRVSIIGNGALKGSLMMLADRNMCSGNMLSAFRMNNVNLAADPEFTDLFVDHLGFDRTDS